MAELKRCPFCGGEAIYTALSCNCKAVLLDEGVYHFVTCKNKCINSLWVRGTSKEKAFQKWNNRHSPWQTGTPTETGWYLLYYPKSEEQPYELAQWDGEHFVAVKPFHAIVVRIEASTVPYWQKIEPYKED